MDIREATNKLYEMMNSGDTSKLDEVMDPNLVDHEKISGVESSGSQAFRDFVSLFRSAITDFRITANDVLIDGERAAIRFTLSGRHTGDQLGMPATGKPFSIEGIDIMRFENGKCVEHWGVSDQLGMMAQLGLVPAP
ncbi:MAG TPA: ester cyclase [Dehalococcoidia bacterium]|nr:ester cyclase [Dehalococcoidia bacterium]